MSQVNLYSICEMLFSQSQRIRFTQRASSALCCTNCQKVAQMATFVLLVALTFLHPLFHSFLLAQGSVQQFGRAIPFIIQPGIK